MAKYPQLLEMCFHRNLAMTQSGVCGLWKIVEVGGTLVPWALQHHLPLQAPTASRFHFETSVMAQHPLPLSCWNERPLDEMQVPGTSHLEHLNNNSCFAEAGGQSCF